MVSEPRESPTHMGRLSKLCMFAKVCAHMLLSPRRLSTQRNTHIHTRTKESKCVCVSARGYLRSVGLRATRWCMSVI